jgi:ABC-type Mn2+/Zn2+ transport system permease subunit
MAKKPRINFLAIGISHAIGFVVGCLAGYWLGKLIGMDMFAPGDDNSSLVGIVLVGLGGGLGSQWARRWQQTRKDKNE